jgi:hypothetical protein
MFSVENIKSHSKESTAFEKSYKYLEIGYSEASTEQRR